MALTCLNCLGAKHRLCERGECACGICEISRPRPLRYERKKATRRWRGPVDHVKHYERYKQAPLSREPHNGRRMVPVEGAMKDAVLAAHAEGLPLFQIMNRSGLSRAEIASVIPFKELQ